MEQGKDPDDIIKEKGKEGFLKFLENKNIIQSFIWQIHKEKVNTNDPMILRNLKKKCANFVHTLKMAPYKNIFWKII